jgi:hypothetical protein
MGGIFNMVLKMVACFFIVFLIMKFYMIIADRVGEELGFSKAFEKCSNAYFKRKNNSNS